MKTYPVFQKAYYTDGDGLLLGVFYSKDDANRFVQTFFKPFKRKYNQPGFTQNGIETSLTCFNDRANELIHCPLDYPHIHVGSILKG